MYCGEGRTIANWSLLLGLHDIAQKQAHQDAPCRPRCLSFWKRPSQNCSIFEIAFDCLMMPELTLVPHQPCTWPLKSFRSMWIFRSGDHINHGPRIVSVQPMTCTATKSLMQCACGFQSQTWDHPQAARMARCANCAGCHQRPASRYATHRKHARDSGGQTKI